MICEPAYLMQQKKGAKAPSRIAQGVLKHEHQYPYDTNSG